jgi:AcrR family transcriptional regulator
MDANSGKGRVPPSDAGGDADAGPAIPSGEESMVVVDIDDESITADWQRRVLGRSLRSATKKSIDRGASLILTAANLLEKSNGDGFTVQDVADEAGQSLRTLYLYFESKDDLLLAVFEEAMKTYARLIREAVIDLDDELERLAGTILAATLMPSHTSSGIDVGLARLRLRLGASAPQSMSQSQRPIAGLLMEATANAARSHRIKDIDDEAAAYLIAVINAGYVTGRTLGNEYGLLPPDPVTLTAFCLRGLGAPIERTWLEDVHRRLRMPTEPVTFRGTDGRVKPARTT